VLNLLQQRFGIATAQAVTLDTWETWGRDTELMRMLADCIIRYGTAVNLHLGDYLERLNREDQRKVHHLLLPPLPKQFRQRFVPLAERHSETRRKRKAQTDVDSECAMAILAVMLARYPSMHRFIGWYRHQIVRIEAGELGIPARLVYEDNELDLPREPGPGAASIEEVRWHSRGVRLDLTIWRPYEFSHWRNAQWMQQTVRGTKERTRAIGARSNLRRRAMTTIHSDPHAYFVELHSTEDMPWFAGTLSAWFAQFALRHRTRRVEASGASGENRAGVGTPEDWLAKYLGAVFASQGRCQRMMDDAKVAMRIIDPGDEARRINRLMDEADERTREVLERYGGLHPVTFGHCGYPGLCVRGTTRSFCIGCPFLVRRPEYLDRVEFFLDSYTLTAEAHERMGDLAGARERRRLIAELKQLRSEMLLLAEAERQGSWTRSWRQLPVGAPAS
jgi:hypothetical protein